MISVIDQIEELSRKCWQSCRLPTNFKFYDNYNNKRGVYSLHNALSLRDLKTVLISGCFVTTRAN